MKLLDYFSFNPFTSENYPPYSPHSRPDRPMTSVLRGGVQVTFFNRRELMFLDTDVRRVAVQYHWIIGHYDAAYSSVRARRWGQWNTGWGSQRPIGLQQRGRGRCKVGGDQTAKWLTERTTGADCWALIWREPRNRLIQCLKTIWSLLFSFTYTCCAHKISYFRFHTARNCC